MALRGIDKKLGKILPAECIITAPELCAAYEVDGMRPSAVVRPCAAAQIAKVLEICAREGWGVIPWGSGTQIGIGNVPRAFDVVLDLADLDSVIEYDADNLTFSANAGCTLRALAELFDKKRQFLPLDPPAGDRATIGGVVAANAFGPSRLRYGAARDLVLGLQVALTNGETIDVGGKTVKNVAGYDLTRAFIGSYGTLGVITRVTCRLLPRPARSQTLVADFSSPIAAFASVAQVLNSRLLPTRLDIVPGELIAKHPDTGVSLIVGIDGSPETVERQSRDLFNLTSAGGASVMILDDDSAEYAYRLTRDLPVTSKAPLIIRSGLPIASSGRFWSSVEQLGGDRKAEVKLLARAGLGFVHVFVEADLNRLIMLAEAIRTLADEMGGYALIERLPAELKADVDIWGPTRSDFPLMKSLKSHFDPTGILNPGRFIGRL